MAQIALAVNLFVLIQHAEPKVRIGLTTSSLPKKRSTTELQRHIGIPCRTQTYDLRFRRPALFSAKLTGHMTMRTGFLVLSYTALVWRIPFCRLDTVIAWMRLVESGRIELHIGDLLA